MGVEKYEGKRGTTYRIRWVDHLGRRKSASFARERDARKALQLRQGETTQIAAGLRSPRPEVRTFGELADYWIEHRVPEKRSGRDDRYSIERHLRPTFGVLPVREVTRERIDAFRKQLEALRIRRAGPGGRREDPAGAPLAPRTIHKVLTLLRAMLNLAEELEWIEHVPKVRKPSVVSHAEVRSWIRSQEDIGRFLATAEAFDREDDAARARGQAIKGPRKFRTHPPGVLPLFATAVYMGMRLGELAALRWADVNLERRRIRVWRSHLAETTKGGYERTVPIPAALLPILTAWKLRSPGPLVFPNVAGKQRAAHDRVWQDVFWKVCEDAGLKRVDAEGLPLVFHSLRHTWASHVAMSGKVDLQVLQRLGGWKDYKTVQRYAHLLPERLEAASDVFHAPDLGARGEIRNLPLPAESSKAAH